MKKLIKQMDETVKEEFNLESIIRIGFNNRRIKRNFNRVDRIEE